ncbi:hypothetical protein ACFQ0B_43230 [Nonomuraea thailandensis]
MRPSRVLTVGFVLVCGLAAGQAASAAPTPPSPSATPSATPAATATTPAPDPNDPPDQVEVPEVSTLAAPSFQLLPCGQSWTGNSSASSAHRSYEIDFNRGSTANADLGDTVVAAAAAPWSSPPTRAPRTATATWSRSTTAAATRRTTRT